MLILSIDTSCDETSAAITEGRRVLSHIEYTQVLTHREWGGVVPSLAKRAHEERIDFVIEEALRKAKKKIKEIKYIAVTEGPGLAIALEVGITKAKETAIKYKKSVIAVNHMEGHIYSSFVQNSKGNPAHNFNFPYLVLLVSGAHTELVIFKNHLEYELIGKKVDDAAGEALDKAARMLGFGYPGGPLIEKMSRDVENKDFFKFPRPMSGSSSLDFSYSGLKTALLYKLRGMTEEERITKLNELASSFQEAVFGSLIIKTEKAIRQTGINKVIVGGGVIANARLRYLIRKLVKKYQGNVLFPSYNYLTSDNAAMIGVAAYYKSERKIFIKNLADLDRIPRLSF